MGENMGNWELVGMLEAVKMNALSEPTYDESEDEEDRAPYGEDLPPLIDTTLKH